MYSPILRNRQSEMLAFKHLHRSVHPHMMPVMDVAAPSTSSDKTKQVPYVEKNIVRMGKVSAGFAAVFVDSSELDSGFRVSAGIHPLVSAASAIASAGAQPIPVTGLHRDAAHNAAAINVLKGHPGGNLCVRLDPTDVSTATLTASRIQSLLTSVSVASSATYLLLDLQCLFEQDKDAVVKQVLRLLTLLGSKPWAGIIVGGYGFPDQLSTAVSTKTQDYLRRIEQEVFRDVSAHDVPAPLWFGDYATLSPSAVELDWRLVRRVMTPRALYTLEDSWFVVRGGAFASHPDGYDQYYSIADEIVALDEYCGPAYSYGDKYIWERAQRTETPGSPASWITACVNHHITFTANAHA